MDTNTVFEFINTMIGLFGLYLFYVYYLLMKKNEIKPGILIPQNTDPKKCRDLDGYKKFINTRILILAATATLCGALGVYRDYVGNVNQSVYMAVYVLFLVALVWYISSVKKTEKVFW